MSEIRSTASFRGKFKQGSTADLLLKITDFDGTPINPTSIECEIVGPIEEPSNNPDNDETIVDSSSPFQASDGYYVYSWGIDSEQTIGNYAVTWTYIVRGIEQTELQTVTVVSSQNNAVPSGFYTERLIAMREALEYHVSCAQTIPIYFEQAKPSRDNTTFEFSFPDWNQSAGVKIYRNEVIINADAEVDYFKGTVTFDTALLPQETVNADYNFRWFSEDQLTRFLVNALQVVNTYPPHSGFTLDTVPDRYFPTILYGAAKDALRQIMFCLNYQQPAQVFGGSDGAKQAFQNFETLKQNYEKEVEKLLEQKKLGPYPKTLAVVTPEFTLPGGRCLHPDTELLVLVTNRLMAVSNSYKYTDVYTNKINNTQLLTGGDVKVYTIKEIYELFSKGFDIEVLSQSDLTGNLVFAPVSYIWESGVKTIYNLKTSNGYSINTSDEHLFYVNGKYIPLREIKVGDAIITCDNHNWENSTVKSIVQSKRKIKMYDLEIPKTANLFANGIKCHNSRWFRYLFK